MFLLFVVLLFVVFVVLMLLLIFSGVVVGILIGALVLVSLSLLLLLLLVFYCPPGPFSAFREYSASSCCAAAPNRRTSYTFSCQTLAHPNGEHTTIQPVSVFLRRPAFGRPDQHPKRLTGARKQGPADIVTNRYMMHDLVCSSSNRLLRPLAPSQRKTSFCLLTHVITLFSRRTILGKKLHTRDRFCCLWLFFTGYDIVFCLSAGLCWQSRQPARLTACISF